MSTGTLLSHFRPAGATGDAGHQGGGGRLRLHNRFGLLLLVLMTTYILSAFVEATWVGALQIGLFVGVTALAAHSGDVKRGMARLLTLAAVGGSVIAITLALTHSSDAVGGVAYLWAAFMLLFAVTLIVRRVLEQPEVSLQSIFGAVSAYMIIGLMFAAIYSAIYHFDGSFFVQGDNHLKTFQYFSFTTLTTLGYGDYTAAQSGGQAVAAMEALLGQIFLATLVARLVAAFRVPDRVQAARSRRASGHDRASPGSAGAGEPAGQGHPADPGHSAGPGRSATTGDPAGSGGQAAPGDLADSADPAYTGGPAGTATPGRRPSPRARARQARRSRLRPER